MSLKKIENYLDKEQIVYFATSVDKQPHVRAMSLIYYKKRFWACTLKSRTKVSELAKNSNCEFCLPINDERGTGSIRGNGKSEIVIDLKVKTELSKVISFFDGFFSSPEDPEYVLIEIKVEHFIFHNPEDKKFSKVVF